MVEPGDGVAAGLGELPRARRRCVPPWPPSPCRAEADVGGAAMPLPGLLVERCIDALPLSNKRCCQEAPRSLVWLREELLAFPRPLYAQCHRPLGQSARE